MIFQVKNYTEPFYIAVSTLTRYYEVPKEECYGGHIAIIDSGSNEVSFKYENEIYSFTANEMKMNLYVSAKSEVTDLEKTIELILF